MDTWMIVAIVAGALVVLALLAWGVAKVRHRREVRHYEDIAIERQERAADRDAEASAILDDAERQRRLAEQAAERARELQAEADARTERAMEVEAEADTVRAEAVEESQAAREARIEAESRR